MTSGCGKGEGRYGQRHICFCQRRVRLQSTFLDSLFPSLSAYEGSSPHAPRSRLGCRGCCHCGLHSSFWVFTQHSKACRQTARRHTELRNGSRDTARQRAPTLRLDKSDSALPPALVPHDGGGCSHGHALWTCSLKTITAKSRTQ